jgi:hypothetical protein
MHDLSCARWTKAARSNTTGDNCVEVALNIQGIVGVRDSKDPAGPALVFTPDEWREFTGRIVRPGDHQ